MISLGPITIIVVIQIILLLIMLVGVLLFMLRKKSKKLNALSHQGTMQDNVSAGASVEHYLTAEIKLTQARFDLFYKADDIKTEAIAEPDWLSLRKNFLETEKELLALSDREDVFWLEIGKKIKALLKNSNLVKRVLKEVEEGDEEEIKEMKMLLKSQQDKFEELSSLLDGEDSDTNMLELKDKLIQLARSHQELSQCMFMLEEENNFMRDQIAALLK